METIENKLKNFKLEFKEHKLKINSSIINVPSFKFSVFSYVLFLSQKRGNDTGWMSPERFVSFTVQCRLP